VLGALPANCVQRVLESGTGIPSREQDADLRVRAWQSGPQCTRRNA
jgi:hypothetical protein